MHDQVIHNGLQLGADGYSKICGKCGVRHGYPLTGARTLDFEDCYPCVSGKTKLAKTAAHFRSRPGRHKNGKLLGVDSF